MPAIAQDAALTLSNDLFPAQVTAVTPRAEGICSFTFTLPADRHFTPEAGSHIQIAVKDGHQALKLNHYSLTNSPGDGAHYHIAVQRESNGNGGSRFMHDEVAVGDTVYVSTQKNDFPLQETAHPVVLIAGGIGLTPIFSMAKALNAKGVPYALHYSARSRSKLAFADEMAALGASFYISDEGQKLDLNHLLGSLSPQTHIYFCGPKGLIQAIIDTGERLGIARDRLHFELFGNADQTKQADKPVDVTLSQSGRTITVPVGISILDALLAEGVECSFGCKRGECGACAVDMLEGTPDHRDLVLTADEKAAGRICICVSRALTPAITLRK